ncbi:uncharacterized protein EI97DRAFT_214334 [Westerdykella ornata]|uniref:Uncharacterized protein n=1 Tax=Westerdykella ornata TaxID=318751 RepID=A0A6A6JR55_WESOR|nr:uncharacterized protein EI97DRAFT_214334 [Westerdykella ornata]KAF2278583.1 hypothetical protein EI97DRAFT_214334 [Westerdykella ornata]
MTSTDLAQQLEALRAELNAAKASENAAIERAQTQYREMRVSIRTAEKLELKLHRQVMEAEGKAGRQADALLYFRWRLDETEKALATKTEEAEKAKALALELATEMEREKERHRRTAELARRTGTSWERMREENERLTKQLKKQTISLQASVSTVATSPQKRTASLVVDAQEDMGRPAKLLRGSDEHTPSRASQAAWTKLQRDSTLNGRSPYASNHSLQRRQNAASGSPNLLRRPVSSSSSSSSSSSGPSLQGSMAVTDLPEFPYAYTRPSSFSSSVPAPMAPSQPSTPSRPSSTQQPTESQTATGQRSVTVVP